MCSFQKLNNFFKSHLVGLTSANLTFKLSLDVIDVRFTGIEPVLQDDLDPAVAGLTVQREGHLIFGEIAHRRNDDRLLNAARTQGRGLSPSSRSEEDNIYLIDAKKAARRVNPGRKTRPRICRVLSDIQKQLGVRMAYVYIDTRAVHIVPEIEESGHYEITLSNAQ